MDHHEYLAWLSEIDGLSPDQRIATVRLLAGQPSLEAVIGLLEERIGTDKIGRNLETIDLFKMSADVTGR